MRRLNGSGYPLLTTGARSNSGARKIASCWQSPRSLQRHQAPGGNDNGNASSKSAERTGRWPLLALFVSSLKRNDAPALRREPDVGLPPPTPPRLTRYAQAQNYLLHFSYSDPFQDPVPPCPDVVSSAPLVAWSSAWRREMSPQIHQLFSAERPPRGRFRRGGNRVLLVIEVDSHPSPKLDRRGCHRVTATDADRGCASVR